MSQQILDTIFLLMFPILFFVIFFLIFYYSNKKKKEVLKKLSSFLTGAISKLSFMPTFNGEYQGLRFSVILIPASRNSPAYLKISLAKNSFFKLTIYKESFLSSLGKKMGIVHEVKINDEMFDKEFLIFSNKPTQVMTYLNNISIKNTVRELFNNGFNAVCINGKQILIQKPNYILEKDVESQNLIMILQKLTLIARGL